MIDPDVRVLGRPAAAGPHGGVRGFVRLGRACSALLHVYAGGDRDGVYAADGHGGVVLSRTAVTVLVDRDVDLGQLHVATERVRRVLALVRLDDACLVVPLLLLG